jgi:hypothetical protein
MMRMISDGVYAVPVLVSRLPVLVYAFRRQLSSLPRHGRRCREPDRDLARSLQIVRSDFMDRTVT